MAERKEGTEEISVSDKLAINLARAAKAVRDTLPSEVSKALLSRCTKFEMKGWFPTHGESEFVPPIYGPKYVFGFGQIKLMISRACVWRGGDIFPTTLMTLTKAPGDGKIVKLPCLGWIATASTGREVVEPVLDSRAVALSVTTDWIHPRLAVLLRRLEEDGAMHPVKRRRVSNPRNSEFTAPADMKILAQAMGVGPAEETRRALDFLCFAAIEDLREKGLPAY